MKESHKRQNAPSPSPSPGHSAQTRKRMHLQRDRTASPLQDMDTMGTDVTLQPDPDVRHSQGRGAALFEASGEWNFRIQVLASTNPTERLFTKAVQDLVQVCFPDGVLTELGCDVVEKHMQEESAPGQNIARMRKIFHVEMIRRIAVLMVDYFQRPEDLEDCLKLFILASRSKYGDKFIHELQHGDTLSRLLQTSAPEGHQTASSALAIIDSTRSGRSSEIPRTFEEASDEQNTTFPTPQKRKAKSSAESSKEKSKKKTKRAKHSEPSEADTERHSPSSNLRHGVENIKMPIQAPVAELNCVDAKKRTKKKRPIRISSSWRWDIDRATFRMGTLDKHFKKPADLFAFHALPVIKGELGPGATNDDIRLRMDEILSELPLTEIKRWDDSFSKLQNGDVNMLGRTVTPDHGQPTSPHVAGIPGSDNVQERDETAPTIRRDDRGVARPGIMSHEPEHVRRNCSVAEVEVKREQEVGAQILVPHEESVMNETISLPRRLSTEPQMNLMSQTPIVGHLWGSETLTDKDFGKFLGKIMGIINQRLPMDTYELSYFGSKSKLLSKRILECDIRNAFKSASFSRERVAYQCESSLMPWVAAQPNSFPEIRKSPLSFVYMFPDITPALDCLIPPNASFPQDNCSTVRRYISFSIKQKEINQLYECGYRNYPLSSQLDSVLMKRNINEAEKRGRVERILRYVALDFKEKFPELKSSKLVRAWEHETGLRW